MDINKYHFSDPKFLYSKIFMQQEFSSHHHQVHKVLVLAVHAIMSESGFIAFDYETLNFVPNGFMTSSWLFDLSLFYTLPQCLSEYQAAINNGNPINMSYVVLDFRSTFGSTSMNVDGILVGSTYSHRAILNKDRYLPCLIDARWSSFGAMYRNTSQDFMASTSSPELKDAFNEFWILVKDNVALPLLFDLCDEAGLVLPPCFATLPGDLKLKILESVPGEDVARASCVCSELRCLGSSDELWKLKFSEELSWGVVCAHYMSWKERFVAHRERWRQRSREFRRLIEVLFREKFG